MSIRELGRRLELSPSLVSRLVRKGMPTESEEGARAWRLQYVRSRRRDGVQPSVSVSAETGETKVVEFVDPAGSAPGGLNASLERLRSLERSTALTLQKLLKEGRIAEAIGLLAQHAAMIKGLFDAETKALRLAQERGELVSVETATKIVIGALREPVIRLERSDTRGEAENTYPNSAVLSSYQSGADPRGRVTRRDGPHFDEPGRELSPSYRSRGAVASARTNRAPHRARHL